MTPRNVVLSPEARDDLNGIYDWIANARGPVVAKGYTDRIEDFCASLDMGAERGTARDDLRPGIRVVGFEGRVAIVFAVLEQTVEVLRISYGGRDWEAAFRSDR